MRDNCLTKTAGRFGSKEFMKVFYVVLAAVLCFVGPTYFVLVLSKVISEVFAVVLGFVCFLVGLFFVFRLIGEF
jgi:hypothetical protein